MSLTWVPLDEMPELQLVIGDLLFAIEGHACETQWSALVTVLAHVFTEMPPDQAKTSYDLLPDRFVQTVERYIQEQKKRKKRGQKRRNVQCPECGSWYHPASECDMLG